MYALVTDTCIDMNPAVLSAFSDYDVLPLSYTLDGVTSTKQLDTPEAVHEFYNRLRSGSSCTTSQVTPGQFYESFCKYAHAGVPVLALIFSSGLSGTYSSACTAKEMTLEEYPNADIRVIDTLCASVGQGLLFYDALMNRKDGMSLDENEAWVKEHIGNYAQWFTVDDLKFLKRGGRCTPSAAFFGSILSIKPVLYVDDNGKLVAHAKVRGRQQAMKYLVGKYGELCDERDHIIFISHGDCTEEAMTLKKMLMKEYGCRDEQIVLSGVGPVIGSHAGPGVLTLMFRAKKRA